MWRDRSLQWFFVVGVHGVFTFQEGHALDQLGQALQPDHAKAQGHGQGGGPADQAARVAADFAGDDTDSPDASERINRAVLDDQE